MRKGTLMSGAFSSLASMLNKVVNTKIITPMVEYNDDGQIIIHLNQLVPTGRGAYNFSFQILFGLLESCYRNQHWKVTPAQYMNIREDMTERLPGLMCDIGGLFAHEVELILGFQLSPAAYRLDHRVKNTTGLMKHTETFTFEKLDHILPTRKEKESMNDQPNTKAEQSDVLTLELNQFLNHGGMVDRDYLFNYLSNCSKNFFVDGLAMTTALAAITPSLDMLSTLTMRHNVMLTIYAKPELGHPGWDFKCTPRLLGDHDGDRPLNTGGMNFNLFHEVFGRHSGRPGGIFSGNQYNQLGDPNAYFGNDVLSELLNLYSLVQIQALPYQARGRYFPAGMELLELVKERLTGSSQTMFNGGMPNMGMPANGPGYASSNFMHQSGRSGAVEATTVGPRYIRVAPGTFGDQGLHTTPPVMMPGDILIAAVLDNTVGRLMFVAANQTSKAYVIYQTTRMGMLIDRCEYPALDAEWPRLAELRQALQLPTVPYQDFSFSVSDNLEDTLYSLKEQIHQLKLPRGQHECVIEEVTAVLKAKPLNSSEHAKLVFTIGVPAFMPEGLREALPEESTRPHGGTSPSVWIIHSGLIEDAQDELPVRFWTLTAGVLPPRCW